MQKEKNEKKRTLMVVLWLRLIGGNISSAWRLVKNGVRQRLNTLAAAIQKYLHDWKKRLSAFATRWQPKK